MGWEPLGCQIAETDTTHGMHYPTVARLSEVHVTTRGAVSVAPDAVIASAADAECVGLNAVSDGRHVVLPVEAVGLAGELASRGFEPVFVDISELLKSGGGPKCATLELRG